MKYADRDLAVRNEVERIFENSSRPDYFEHTLRVCAFADYIGRREGANLSIVVPAALLHDVGMTIDPSFVGHPKKSAVLGQGVLSNVGYSESESKDIIETLLSHHPATFDEIDTVEKRVLFDADSLEIVGSFGLLRWIGGSTLRKSLDGSFALFQSIVDKGVEHRGSLFFTSTARSLGDSMVKDNLSYFEKVKSYLRQFDDDGQLEIF